MANNLNIELTAEDIKRLLKGKNSSEDEEIIQEGTITLFQNHIYFYADINPASTLRLNNFLIKMFKENVAEAAQSGEEPKVINLHINSPGGLASAGFLAYDTIMEIREKVPVYTYVEGLAASAATFLSIAGSKRFITPSSNLVIHEVRSWIGGTASQIMEEYQNLIKIENRVEQLYLRHTNFELAELKEFLKRDCLMTAEEALERKLVDEIKTCIF